MSRMKKDISNKREKNYVLSFYFTALFVLHRSMATLCIGKEIKATEFEKLNERAPRFTFEMYDKYDKLLKKPFVYQP